MIKTESEYLATCERIREQANRMDRERTACIAEGCTPTEVERLLEPVSTFHAQLCEEAKSYEKLKKGDFGEFQSLREIGKLLIAVRIHSGLTQRELADALGVHESQVSRDERNDYHGITVERANRIFEALKVELRTQFVVSSKARRSPQRGSVLTANR